MEKQHLVETHQNRRHNVANGTFQIKAFFKTCYESIGDINQPTKAQLFWSEEVYLNIFEDTTDPLERRLLAQRIIDVIALRPRLDLQDTVDGVTKPCATVKKHDCFF